MPKSPELSRSPDYFAARAIEERRNAMAAKDPKVRAIHFELAEKYAALAEGRVSSPKEDPDQERDQA